MKKPVAVIILNWNGEKLLHEFLPSVVDNTPDDIADVIVADNGSTDGSLELLCRDFPGVKVVKFAENLGFAEGYNEAIRLTAYKYTLLLNSDVAVPQGWLQPLYDFMESHPETGACQPKLLSYTNRDEFEYAGGCGGFIDCNGYPYCRGRIFSSIEKDKKQYDDCASIFWATGAALMVRSHVYLKAGGLDKHFFAHMEEIDLCWRIHLLGYDIKAVPQAHAFHLGGGSLPASNPRKTYLNFRNNLFLLHKNLPQKDGKRIIFRRMIWDAIAFAMFLVTGHFSDARAIVKAHNDYRKMKSRYNNYPDKNLLKTFRGAQTNIVLAHYIRGVKKFSQLKL